MRSFFTVLTVLVLMFAVVPVQAQTHEVAVGGSIIGSDGVGYGAPFWGATASGQVHVLGFDFGGEFTRVNFPTIGTPGGYGKTAGAHVKYWFSERFFAGVDYTHAFKTPTGFTKSVDFVGVSGGIRLVGEPRVRHTRTILLGDETVLVHDLVRGRHEDRIIFSFDKDVNTDGFPHRVSVWTTRWFHDFPIGARQAIRLGAAYSFSRYDQMVLRTHIDHVGITQYKELDRVSGNAFTLSISYVFKGS